MFLYQHRLVRINLCHVSLTGRSLFCNRFARVGETVLADWLIYYIQVSLFVKEFFRPISKLVSFLCQTTSFFPTPFFGARANYMHSRLSVKGQFRNSFFLVLKQISFDPFLTARRNYTHPGQRVKRQLCIFEHFKVKVFDSLR
jgi:hypothetical protein